MLERTATVGAPNAIRCDSVLFKLSVMSMHSDTKMKLKNTRRDRF